MNTMARKKNATDRYEIKHYSKVFERYKDRDWAIHSAECYASFYNLTIAVVDRTTGDVVAVRQPRKI